MEKVATRSLALEAAQQEVLLDLLREHVPQAEVWAYGSRVTGRSHEGSDLDIVVRTPRNPADPTPGVSALREALRQSSLPMLVDVHDWADLPVSFRSRIEQEHVVLNVA